MGKVSTVEVRKHIVYLGMSTAELAERSGLHETTIRGMKRNPTTRESSAVAVLAVQKPAPHPTTITEHLRVTCECGYTSQRFGTLGLAKARAREHASTGR